MRLKYKGKRKVGEICSKHFTSRVQSPLIKERRRGEKRRRKRRRRSIKLKIMLEGFLWEAIGKIHTTTIHHLPQQWEREREFMPTLAMEGKT